MKDIFLFQMANWLSGFVWFATFLRYENTGNVGRIASAELMFSFVGIYLTHLSIRLHKDAVSQLVERHAIYIRVAVVFVSIIAINFNAIEISQFLAILAFAVTPAHLPLLMGYRFKVMWPLILRLPLAIIFMYSGGVRGDQNVVATIYFLPTIGYGLLTYVEYYKVLALDARGAKHFSISVNEMSKSFLQLATTIFCNIFQAKIVESLVVNSASFAVLERLLRSVFSFTFPYLVRKGFVTTAMRMRIGYSSILLILICACGGIFLNYRFNLFLPVLGDIYTSLIAGRVIWLDCIVAATLPMILISI